MRNRGILRTDADRPPADVAGTRVMDLSRFGLTRRPFPSTPATDLYVPTPPHEAAVAALRAAHDNRDGVALLDGEPGTGKTLAALRFLEALPPATGRVLIPAPRFARPSD